MVIEDIQEILDAYGYRNEKTGDNTIKIYAYEKDFVHIYNVLNINFPYKTKIVLETHIGDYKFDNWLEVSFDVDSNREV